MSDSAEITKKANEIILESIAEGVFTVDHNWRIMTFNRAAEEITGTPRADAIGRYCWEVFRSNMCEGACALKRTMKEGKSFVSSATYIINSRQQKVPITVSTSPLKDEDGKVLGGVETFRDHSLVEELRRELSGSFSVGDMVSRSKAMKKIFNILPQVAESDSTVLVEGDTGTGKELMARALHELSWRKNEPFVAINCGALPDSLLESELFGYKAGAFTNADKDKPGLFQAAVRAPSSSTRSAIPAVPFRYACCGFWRRGSSSPSAGSRRSRPISASLPPPIGTWPPWWKKASSAAICFTALMLFACICRP